MKSSITLLLSSAGRRVGLLECFRQDALALGVNLRVIATDIRPELSAACASADLGVSVPPCTDPQFEARLSALCEQEAVDLVVPTIDTELPVLAALQESLRKIGTRAVISSSEVVALARDKFRTAKQLAARGIRTPQTAMLADGSAENVSWSWPVIVKPNSGSSSIGIRLAGREELRSIKPPGDMIVQERLVGKEYTVNMFFDQTGTLKCAIPHLRIETRAGEVSKGETVRFPALEEMAWALGEEMTGARGPICFQAIVDENGNPSLFEINARFGGGFPLAHKAGAHFTRWLLQEAADLPSSAANAWRPGLRMLRYDAAIFS